MKIFLLIIVIFWFIFALNAEIKDQKNAFLSGIYEKNDSLYKSLIKLKRCISYDCKTIKWRRSYLIANIITILIFIIIHKKIPSCSDYLLHMIIIFLGYNFMWENYVKVTSKQVLKYANENLKNIRKYL